MATHEQHQCTPDLETQFTCTHTSLAHTYQDVCVCVCVFVCVCVCVCMCVRACAYTLVLLTAGCVAVSNTHVLHTCITYSHKSQKLSLATVYSYIAKSQLYCQVASCFPYCAWRTPRVRIRANISITAAPHISSVPVSACRE
jgi:hypothetical protein